MGWIVQKKYKFNKWIDRNSKQRNSCIKMKQMKVENNDKNNLIYKANWICLISDYTV